MEQTCRYKPRGQSKQLLWPYGAHWDRRAIGGVEGGPEVPEMWRSQKK